MNRRFLILALVFFLLPAAAFADAQDDANMKVWKSCKTDEDCVEVQLPCGSDAVNKKYESDADAYLQNNAYKALDCPDKTVDPHRRIICDLNVPCADSPTGVCTQTRGTCAVLHPSQQ